MANTLDFLSGLRKAVLETDHFLSQKNGLCSYAPPLDSHYPHLMLEAVLDKNKMHQRLFSVGATFFSLDQSGLEAAEACKDFEKCWQNMPPVLSKNVPWRFSFQKKSTKRTERNPYILKTTYLFFCSVV